MTPGNEHNRHCKFPSVIQGSDVATSGQSPTRRLKSACTPCQACQRTDLLNEVGSHGSREQRRVHWTSSTLRLVGARTPARSERLFYRFLESWVEPLPRNKQKKVLQGAQADACVAFGLQRLSDQELSAPFLGQLPQALTNSDWPSASHGFIPISPPIPALSYFLSWEPPHLTSSEGTLGCLCHLSFHLQFSPNTATHLISFLRSYPSSVPRWKI